MMNKMDLYVVTFETDCTQFIVNTAREENPEKYALKRAMEVNHYPELGGIEEIKEEVNDSSNYTIEPIDMKTLGDMLLNGGAYGGTFVDTIVIHN